MPRQLILDAITQKIIKVPITSTISLIMIIHSMTIPLLLVIAYQEPQSLTDSTTIPNVSITIPRKKAKISF